MRSIVLSLILLAGTSGAQSTADAPAPRIDADAAITAYLDKAVKLVKAELILDGLGMQKRDSAKRAVDEMRPSFDAAHDAAGGSKDTQDALDEHWLLVNRCINGGGDTRFEKARNRADCEGDLAAAQAKVELKWSRHQP